MVVRASDEMNLIRLLRCCSTMTEAVATHRFDRHNFKAVKLGAHTKGRWARLYSADVQNVELAHELITKLKSFKDERPSERDLGEYERKTNFFQRVLEEELARPTVG
jgi:hypothetical protein